MTELSPSTPPAPATFRIRPLPSRDVVESFAFPEHSTYAPRRICPSTKSNAPPGNVVKWLASESNFSPPAERPQNQLSFRNLQVKQLSMISNPYGVFISAAFLNSLPSSAGAWLLVI